MPDASGIIKVIRVRKNRPCVHRGAAGPTPFDADAARRRRKAGTPHLGGNGAVRFRRDGIKAACRPPRDGRPDRHAQSAPQSGLRPGFRFFKGSGFSKARHSPRPAPGTGAAGPPES
ncbi:hypothetical protein [Azospirillum argentinense]